MVMNVPRPEDERTFTPAELYGLIQARLDMFDDTIRDIPNMVRQEMDRQRSERRKKIIKWLNRYIPAGGYASMLGFIVELLIS